MRVDKILNSMQMKWGKTGMLFENQVYGRFIFLNEIVLQIMTSSIDMGHLYEHSNKLSQS